METNLDLIITANHANLTADFRLLDSAGSQVAYRQTDFKPVPVSRQALFDLRDYLELYVEPGGEEEAIGQTGVLIAEQILGEEIFLRLWEPEHQRTLRIQLPGAADEDNHLAAALARVPWEIARPTMDTPSLAERNLLVRIVHEMKEPATEPSLSPGTKLCGCCSSLRNRGNPIRWPPAWSAASCCGCLRMKSIRTAW